MLGGDSTRTPAACRRRHVRPAVGGMLLLALVGLLGVGCGDTRDGPPLDELLAQLDRARDAEQEELVEAIGERGRADPDTVVPKLLEALATERRNPYMDEIRFAVDFADDALVGPPRTTALTRISRTMARRLNVYGYSAGSFTVEPKESAVLLRIPRPLAENAAQEQALVEVMIERLAAPGSFELMIEVLPPDDAAEVESIWTASRRSFETYLEEETALLQAAIRERRPYVPSRPDYQVSLVRPVAPGEEPGLVVLRRPAGQDERFDHESLTLKAGTHTESGDLVLEFTVAEDRHEALAAWSGRHLGRRLAFVLNGRTELLTPLSEPLGGVFRLHLGPRDDPRIQVWLQGMLRALAAGSHAHPVLGELTNEVADDAVTPLVRCLAAVGQVAAPALVQAVRDGGRLGARSRTALEYLQRRLSLGDKERGIEVPP